MVEAPCIWLRGARFARAQGRQRFTITVTWQGYIVYLYLPLRTMGRPAERPGDPGGIAVSQLAGVVSAGWPAQRHRASASMFAHKQRAHGMPQRRARTQLRVVIVTTVAHQQLGSRGHSI